VSGLVGWRDYVVMNPKGQLNKLPPGAPLELAMSVFGATGITAYFGLLDVGRPGFRRNNCRLGRGWRGRLGC
jgi:NADPH-dependent curcumin reductase